MFKLRLKIIELVAKKYPFILPISRPAKEGQYDGAILCNLPEGAKDGNALSLIAGKVMAEDENVKAFILSAALTYLRKYEVDQKTFLWKLKEEEK